MIAALLLVFTYAAFSVGRVPGLRSDRVAAAVIGAVSLVASGTLSMSEARASVDGGTLGLLFGMMVLSVALEVSGAFGLLGCGCRGSRSGLADRVRPLLDIAEWPTARVDLVLQMRTDVEGAFTVIVTVTSRWDGHARLGHDRSPSHVSHHHRSAGQDEGPLGAGAEDIEGKEKDCKQRLRGEFWCGFLTYWYSRSPSRGTRTGQSWRTMSMPNA